MVQGALPRVLLLIILVLGSVRVLLLRCRLVRLHLCVVMAFVKEQKGVHLVHVTVGPVRLVRPCWDTSVIARRTDVVRRVSG